MNIHDYPICIVCWHQETCGHCKEFIPRLRAAAAQSCIPVLLLDAGENPLISDAYRIAATPTVTAHVHGRTVERFDRALDDGELAALFEQYARQCAVRPAV
jgi:thioredoxin-like negative regulator of GroEL